MQSPLIITRLDMIGKHWKEAWLEVYDVIILTL